MYTRVDFGKELKQKIASKLDILEIGDWCHEIYAGDVDNNDIDFLNILLSLGTMGIGPEFEMSYERLNEIADDLIAGKKDINMDY